LIQIMGDLIADISMRLPSFPVQARDIHRLSYLEVGPGGACNVAIMAARFGMDVGVLGEVGDDGFGLVVREGLKREGVSVDELLVTPGAETPVAGVVVDRASEPAYLGHPGSLQVNGYMERWTQPIQQAEAMFADGWAEHDYVPAMLLRGFALAKEAGVPVYFDPGPGNPDVDNGWWSQAIELASVVLLNRPEARRITSTEDEAGMIAGLMEMGAEVVLLKRGAGGLLLARGDERELVDGFKVNARDATGAGDSLAGAVLYGMQRELSLRELGLLANATGAAKVQKLGTGHNMPTMEEIALVLENNQQDPAKLLPAAPGA
jgi:sugar/nucleoside kinase (ribokinase family)